MHRGCIGDVVDGRMELADTSYTIVPFFWMTFTVVIDFVK